MTNEKVRKLLAMSNEGLTKFIQVVPTDKFRALLEEMVEGAKSEWSIAHDGRQWVLHQAKEVAVLGENKQPTGEVKIVEVTAGYFPKFAQALGAMYEGMVGEELGVVNGEEIAAAVARAGEIALSVREVKSA